LCLSTLSADESASVKKIRLILLDGTWKKAYKMWQLSTNLHAIPTVKLPENLQGHYTIRKAPSENSLSTVEAGYHALSLVEPDKDFEPLLTAFEKMIEFQIAQMPPGVFEKNYLKGE
jgi:DTW domain-containing protein YfiP